MGRNDIIFWLLTTPDVAAGRRVSLERQLNGRAQLRLLVSDRVGSMPVPQDDDLRYLSTGMYLRLFLPDIVPADLTRLLYLDSDVLVWGDLGVLWDESLGEAPLGAVLDGFTRTMGHRGGVPGAGPQVRLNAPYFNSGVLLINIPRWRQLGITQQCLAYVRANRDRLRFPDQDALNLVTYGQWRRLEHQWNDTLFWWLVPGEREPRGRVRITHFIGQQKPWHADFPYTCYRERYLELAARIAAPEARSAHRTS
jgi:lipopolysaccharide biosynthesis glycosyltransferase